MKKYFIILIIFALMNGATAQNWDISLLRNINKNQSNANTKFFNLASNSAYILPIAYPVLAFTIGKINKDNPSVRESFFSAVSLGTVFLFTYTLKEVVKRPRPYITYPDLIVDKPEKSYSFPSGHTSIAFCTATSISLYYNKWYVTLPAFAWAATVATSRMYLGKHFPTDVLGGIVLGTAIPLLFHFWKPINLFIDKTGKSILKY